MSRLDWRRARDGGSEAREYCGDMTREQQEAAGAELRAGYHPEPKVTPIQAEINEKLAKIRGTGTVVGETTWYTRDEPPILARIRLKE